MTTEDEGHKSLLDYDHPELDPAEAAAKILAALGIRGARSELLLAPVTSWLIDHRRNIVRGVERKAWRGGRHFAGAAELFQRLQAEQELGDLLPLLSCTFTVTQGGDVVSWGDASVAQHRARAEAQRAHAAATLIDADRHEQIADLLDKAGVDSLSELLRSRGEAAA